VYRLIEERVNLASAPDTQAIIPRLDDSGIPEAIDRYLGQLERALIARHDPTENQISPEGVKIPVARSEVSGASHVAAASPNTPASSSQPSETITFTPMAEAPRLEIVETGVNDSATRLDFLIQERNDVFSR
jgi:hypothetical protein